MNQTPKPQSEMRPVELLKGRSGTLYRMMSNGMLVRHTPKVKGKANVKAHRKDRRDDRKLALANLAAATV